MPKYLVIVESPAKVKTIKKFLGSNYEVLASNGHVRDLPKSRLGIDVEHDYEPKYITIRGKGDILAALRKAEKKADKVYLATDPDREGEAISWHLAAALNLPADRQKRITFNEITKTAVKESLKHPRAIDMNLVDAQQTRRMLDRMVGYRISPVLWDKVKRGLSAGRVQSAALRIIADREEEIASFIPEEYWTLEAKLLPEGQKTQLTASFYGKEKKMELKSREQVDEIIRALQKEAFTVEEVKKSERMKKPPLPFTTSTLQQEAANILNFSTQKTMRIAQQLYEGVDLKDVGTVGLITYLRTDSTRISDEAQRMAGEYILANYGEKYAGRTAASAADDTHRIQDAHEAIRPSDISRTPFMVKDSLSRDQFRLYQLIWKRFAASQMAPARYENTTVKIKAGGYFFQLGASRMLFDGFQSVYSVNGEEKEAKDLLKIPLEKGDVLNLKDLEGKQHFTAPPAHFTEASLVHVLEEDGIGRPSTYAPTITTIISRRYVSKENKNLYMTELGTIVNGIMKEAFPAIVDVRFTAMMESMLDSVEEGKVSWKTVVENFYPDLDESVKKAEKSLEKVSIADEESDEICELCGRRMVFKYGPHGRFLACPGFPDCRNTKPYFERIGVKCPQCGKDIVLRRTRKGRVYYGCEGAPECSFMSWQKPSSETCPQCGSYMLEKGNRIVCADPNCGYVHKKSESHD